jgi:hypothetical protein
MDIGMEMLSIWVWMLAVKVRAAEQYINWRNIAWLLKNPFF